MASGRCSGSGSWSYSDVLGCLGGGGGGGDDDAVENAPAEVREVALEPASPTPAGETYEQHLARARSPQRPPPRDAAGDDSGDEILRSAAARWPPASAAARLSSSITSASSKVGSSFCAPASIYASFSPRSRFLTLMRLRVSTKASAKKSRQSPQMPHTTYSSVCVCPVTGCGRRGSKSTMQPGKGLARASDELARGRTALDACICQEQVWRLAKHRYCRVRARKALC